MFALNYLRSTSFDSHNKTWSIDQVKESDIEDILDYVKEHYLKHEPLVKCLLQNEKPQLLMEVFRDILRQGLSVVARKVGLKNDVVGFSINSRSTKDSGPRLLNYSKSTENINLKKLLGTFAAIEIESNLNEKFCQDQIFSLDVISVHEKYWGQDVRKELVKKSVEIAVEQNFRYIKVHCTNEFSKKAAEKFKLTKAWSQSYEVLLKSEENAPSAYPEHPHHHAYVFYLDLAVAEKQKIKKPSILSKFF